MPFALNQVEAVPLPPESLLHPRIAPQDFLDCYRVPSPMGVRDAAEVITRFPIWARGLVKLRNLFVTPLGLKGDSGQDGDHVGLFPVETQTDQELIAGFNDRHLNFRVSVLTKENHVHLATWVHRNNVFGRAYLATIMPFHILIAKDALARVAHAQ